MINFMNTLLPSHKNEQILLNNSLKDKKIIAIHAIKKDLFITFVKNTKLLALTSFTNIIHSLFDAVSFQVNSHNSENNSFFNSHNLLNKIIFDNPENKEILNTLINKTEFMDNLTLICKHNNYQGLRKHLNYFSHEQTSSVKNILAWLTNNTNNSDSIMNPESLDLSNSDLAHADLSKINLNNINFSGANLTYANLESATFYNCKFIDANLSYTNCINAKITKSDLSNVNLNEANLKKSNLSDSNLSNASMINTILENANLKNTNLQSIKSENLNLLGASLDHTNFTNAKLIKAIITKIIINQPNFEDADLSYATLTHLNLSSAILTRVIFYKADLSYSIFNYLSLDCLNFEGANLFSTVFFNTKLINVNFNSCDLKYATLIGSKIIGCDLSHAILARAKLEEVLFQSCIFTGVSFKHANLERVSLMNADLSNVDLSYANLAYANFEETNFSQAQFSMATFMETNFTNANFTGVNFSSLDLKKSYFKGANFTGSNLSKANFSYCNLSKVNFQLSIWNKTVLSFANCSSSDLSDLTLQDSVINNCNFYIAILSNSVLENLDLSDNNFTEANLTNTRFNGSILKDVNFTKANLTNADLTNTDLSYANFFQTIMTGANLSNTKLLETNFTDAIIINATISLNLDFDALLMMPDNVMSLINMLINSTVEKSQLITSILKSIISINPRYLAQSIKLLLTLMKHHEAIDLYHYKNSLLTIYLPHLPSNSNYANDSNLSSIYCQEILEQRKRIATSSAVQFEKIEGFFILNHLKKLNNIEQQLFITENCILINQLLYFLEKNSNYDEFTETFNAIKLMLFTTPKIASILSNTEGIPTKVINNNNIILDDEYYLLYDIKSQLALVVDKNYLDKFLFKIEHPENTNTNWDNFYLIKGNKIQTIEKVNIHNIFETFKLFLSEYLIAETRAKFTSLVRLLHIEDLFDKAFLRALNNKTLKIPLIGHPEKMILKQHFAPLLIPEDALELADTTALNANITINNNHLNAIKTAFEITNASPEQQAQTLLTISGVFAKYSSSNFFGTELDSPDELRRYALALLNKASELCSHLVPQETLLSWRYRFLGINEAFSCTAILSDMILEYCIKNFRNLAQTIIPPTWC